MKTPRPTFEHEISLWQKGLQSIAGADEVGRGSFAGPVVAAAVMFPKGISFKNSPLGEINDSKLLSHKKRVTLSKLIKEHALSYSISEIDVPTINTLGIGKAAQKAFTKAIQTLSHAPDFCLVDAFSIPEFNREQQKAIIHGDRISISIAAASIIAKVYRDELMEKLHATYPAYNFLKNKGYGTLFHRQMIQKHGLTPLHRTSFNLGLSLKT